MPVQNLNYKKRPEQNGPLRATRQAGEGQGGEGAVYLSLSHHEGLDPECI